MRAGRSARPVDTGTTELLAHLDGGVGVVVLNRPGRRNALTLELLEALGRVLAAFDADPEVACILLTGAGAAFCAGADVLDLATQAHDAAIAEETDEQRRDRQLDLQLRTVGRLQEMATPSVAALPGAVAGAGLGLALACDLRIGCPHTLITTAFVGIGLPGDFGVPWLLHHLVGPGLARRLMLLGERVDGPEAAELGLVDWLVPDPDLHERAHAIAASLAAAPRPAVGAIKANLREAPGIGLTEAMTREVERVRECARTPEHRDAVAAFARGR